MSSKQALVIRATPEQVREARTAALVLGIGMTTAMLPFFIFTLAYGISTLVG